MSNCALVLQTVLSKRSFTFSPAAYLSRLDSEWTSSPANPQFRHRLDRAYAVLPDLVPAIRRASCRAIPRASAARRDPASAAVPLAADFRAGFPSAARSVVPA